MHGVSPIDSDLVRNVAADVRRAVSLEFRAVGGAAGIPRPLAKVGLLQVGDLVGAESLEAAVEEFLRPHGRDHRAEILDELTVLVGVNLARPQKIASDHGRRLARIGSLEHGDLLAVVGVRAESEDRQGENHDGIHEQLDL